MFANLSAFRNKLEDRFRNYKGVDLKFEYSKGASNFPNILHVSILPPEQKVSNGIYVVICFDKLGRGAVAGCAESKTHPKGLDVIIRKKSNKDELLIDVDGGKENTKYNNTFANPKEFHYELVDDSDLINHLEISLNLVLYKLGYVSSSDLSVNELVLTNTLFTQFDPKNIQDAKERITREITDRKGQGKFRLNLLHAYNFQCAISGSTVQQILEAAHIIPYNGKDTNHVQNGILLRADLHTLFDLQLITIDSETYTIGIDDSLKNSEYKIYNGRKLNLPKTTEFQPSKEAIILRNKSKIN